jgi:hypothetical protein
MSPQRFGLLLLLGLLACKRSPEDQCKAAVNIDGECYACPPGSVLRQESERVSGRTSGASLREHFCEQNAMRVGPYAKWRDGRYFISGGHYDAAGQPHGEWTDWNDYGYGGAQRRGQYQHGEREGRWVKLLDGKPVCAERYARGKLVSPCR